jgi:Holliday junction resolvase-like predicted endonuclease
MSKKSFKLNKKTSSTFKCFQSESTFSGKEYEKVVNKDLLSKGYTIIEKNKKIVGIGINVDCVVEKNGIVEYVEDKGGKSGKNKRPGAKRTDNVKKAICNGALLKAKYPNSKYVIYFSEKPKEGSSSEEMINTAIACGYVDEVRYLSY